MIKYSVYINTLLVFLVFTSLSAQVTNVGELTILENTEVVVQNDLINEASGSVLQNGELFLNQNFTNNGQFSFVLPTDTNQAITYFTGATIQKITSAQMSDFYNLAFQNTVNTIAYDLNGKISIHNKASFDLGILQSNLAGNEIKFTIDAIAENMSDMSFVEGEVFKEGDNEFVFPTGANTYYRPIKISAPVDVDEVFSASYINENSNANYPHVQADATISHIDTNEYWILEQKEGTSTVNITLNWNNNTTSTSILSVNDKQQIHILRWDAVNENWVDEGGIVDEARNSVTTIATVNDYGVFTLGIVTEEDDSCFSIFNGITNNGDDVNAVFKIGCIEEYPDNSVEIYNRWGNEIYRVNGYNNTTKAFRGYSENANTINKGTKLPTGTYFYVLKYKADGVSRKKIGYLYIN